MRCSSRTAHTSGRRTRIRPSGCGCWRTPAGPTSRSRPGSSSVSVRPWPIALDSLFAIRQVARAYGAIQEVIVQNFRAKPDTAMARMPDAGSAGPRGHRRGGATRARPTHAHPGAAESDRRRVRSAPSCRDRRLGRGVATDPRPRQSGAAVAADRRACRTLGGRRLPAGRAANGLPALRSRRRAVARSADRRARRGTRRDRTGWHGPTPRHGSSVAGAEDVWLAGGRTDLHTAIDTEGRTSDRRGDFDAVYGDWDAVREQAVERPRPSGWTQTLPLRCARPSAIRPV